ncbi:hypothetical protein BDW75DRAFT_89973 [Aspergillus navahoensis]
MPPGSGADEVGSIWKYLGSYYQGPHSALCLGCTADRVGSCLPSRPSFERSASRGSPRGIQATQGLTRDLGMRGECRSEDSYLGFWPNASHGPTWRTQDFTSTQLSVDSVDNLTAGNFSDSSEDLPLLEFPMLETLRTAHRHGSHRMMQIFTVCCAWKGIECKRCLQPDYDPGPTVSNQAWKHDSAQ